MAAAAPVTKVNQRTRGAVSCGNCLEVEGYLINPVRLPCGHVFCETCLQEHHENTQVITCFTCKEKCETSIDDIPSAMPGGKPAFCNPCCKRGQSKMSARVNCSICNMKLCAKHEQSHADCYPEHDVTEISDQLQSSGSSVTEDRRYCETHKDQSLSIGCNRCWKICCAQCLASLDPCTNVSGDHKMISVEHLADLTKSKLEPYKNQAEERFEQLSALVKETTIQISQWDVDTEANVRIIHRTRDEQVEAIKERYAELEHEYVTSRSDTKQKMTEYIETDIGVKLSEFNDQLKKFRQSVTKTHPVDLVREREEIQVRIDWMIKGDIPTLTIVNQFKVSQKEEKQRAVDLEIQPDADITVGKTHKQLPTRLVLKKKLQFQDFVTSVCHHKGYTYVAVDQDIARVSPDGSVDEGFITCEGDINSVKASDDALVVLLLSPKGILLTYDWSATPIRTWVVSDEGGGYGSRLSIYKNQIHVLHPSTHSIIIYSFNGDLLKTVNQFPANDYISFTQCGRDSLVVTSSQGKAFVVKHKAGQVIIKTFGEPLKSTAITSLDDQTVLLAESTGLWAKQITVKALNISTGEISTLTSDHRTNVGSYTDIFDLCLSGNDLIVPLFGDNIVYWFKLEYSSDVLRQAGEEKLNLTSSDGDDSETAVVQMLPGRDSSRSRDIDGGTAWFCVLGAFIMTALMGGIEKSFGVLLISIQARYGCTTVEASWIGSIMTTLRHLMGVFSGMIAQRFGGRRIAFLGALLMFTSMCASSFVKTLPLLYLTYGFIPGIGASLMYISMTLIINERFIRLRGKANGISLAGSGLGSFGGPVLIQYLLDTYGLSGEMLIIGAVTANYLLCAALFIPARKERKTESVISENSSKEPEGLDKGIEDNEQSNVLTQKKDRQLQCDCTAAVGLQCTRPPVGFVLLCFSLALVSAGYIAFIYYLPSLALLNKDITPTMSALLISIVGICDLIGRITSGIIFDIGKVIRWRRHLYCSTFLIMSLVNLSLPYCTQYYQMCICSALTGYSIGVVIGQRAVMCLDTVGEELLKRFYGLLVSSQGVGFLIGPAAAGALKDYFVTEGYAAAYFFCSAAQFLAVLLFSASIVIQYVPPCCATWRGKADNSQQNT